MTRILGYVATFACAAHPAWSQGITFDTHDAQSVYAVGNTVVVHVDTLTAMANIGSPGETSWDFSNLSTTSLMNLESVPVASTPFAADMPLATHALRDPAFNYSFYYSGLGTTITLIGTGYVYYGAGSDLLNYGLKGVGNAYLYGNPYPAQGQWLNSPASVDYDLPLQLFKSWTSEYTESISGSANLGGFPVPFGPLDTRHSITYTVDAYGPLTLPGGQAQEALRIRKADRYGSSATDKLHVGYIFLAKNGAAVHLTVADTSAVGGTVPVNSVQWIEGSGDPSVPIELARFTATQEEGRSVRLEWETLSETNNFGFTIERKGADDAAFTELPGSFVAGHGTTIVPQKYSYRDTPETEGAWWYRLKQIDLDGAIHLYEPIRAMVVSTVRESLPVTYEVLENYPNPFNPSTTIRYGLPHFSHVTIGVFDMLGREVASLVNGEREAGYHEVQFDGTGLASGVYFYRLRARALSLSQRGNPGSASGSFVAARKLLLSR